FHSPNDRSGGDRTLSIEFESSGLPLPYSSKNWLNDAPFPTRQDFIYLTIFATTPAPTVRPPSRIAKRRPSSIAIGWIRLTTILMLSPGMTISTPSGSSHEPVTSVVRK